jgi:hypothetical protein
MSISVQSHPATYTQPQPQLTTPPNRLPLSPNQTAPLTQDKVTISPQAQLALANNAKPTAGGDVDHDGDNH